MKTEKNKKEEEAKKPTEDGKLVKEPKEEPKKEDEKCNKEVEEEDDSDLTEDEKKAYNALKMKIKRKVKKAEGSALSPEESEARSTTQEGTITPELSVPSKPQDVFVPPSQVTVDRTQDTPMGKSSEPELVKSPMYVGLSGQLDDMRKALDAKLEGIAKSYNDRLDNMKKSLDTAEAALKAFNEKPFYKAINDGMGAESIQKTSIAEQIKNGEVRYRN